MAGGLELGAALQGGSEGLRRIEGRKSAELSNEMRGLQIDEAKASAERRPIMEARQDEEYEFKKKERDRRAAGMVAMRNFMVNDDLGGAVNYMNTYGPENTKFFANANDDGTYDIVREMPDGKTEKRTIEKDEIGEAMSFVANADPAMLYESRRKERKGAEAKKGEQDFEMAKLREEYRLKAGIEKIKLGKGSETNRKIENDLWGRAAKGRGLDIDTLDFNTRTGMMAAYDAKLSSDIYPAVGSTNEAHLRAKSIVNKLDAQVSAKLDEAGLQGEERDTAYERAMDQAINKAAQKLRARKGQRKQEGKTGDGLKEPKKKPAVKEGDQTKTVNELGKRYGIDRRDEESDDDYELRIRTRIESDMQDQKEKKKERTDRKEGLTKTGSTTGSAGLTSKEDKKQETGREKTLKAMAKVKKIDEYKTKVKKKSDPKASLIQSGDLRKRANKLAKDFKAGKDLSEAELRDALHAGISNLEKIKIVDKLDEMMGGKKPASSDQGLTLVSR